jgi:hypothetical protein
MVLKTVRGCGACLLLARYCSCVAGDIKIFIVDVVSSLVPVIGFFDVGLESFSSTKYFKLEAHYVMLPKLLTSGSL